MSEILCKCGKEAKAGRYRCAECYRVYMRELMRRKRGTKILTTETKEITDTIKESIFHPNRAVPMIKMLPVTFGGISSIEVDEF